MTFIHNNTDICWFPKKKKKNTDICLFNNKLIYFIP